MALPHIPGHEFAGVVVRVGADTHAFAVGDRVTAPFVFGCGRCEWCRTGSAQVCPFQVQPGFTQAGSFAEQVAVQAADLNLVRLPDQLDFESAAVLGCRFATAFRALTGTAHVSPEASVAVFGCGGVGLSAVMIASALGARVIAVDVSPPALARAAALGASVTIGGHDPAPAVREASNGGVHISLDAVGSAATAEASIRSLRPRGCHVQVGLLLGTAGSSAVPWELVVAQELQIVGSHGMAAADYPAMLKMITDGRLDPRRLLGSVVSLDGAGRALMAMDAQVSARAGVTVASLPGPPPTR